MYEDREIVISRVIDAPRDQVWEAWTDPEQIPRWWGPDGFTTTTHEMDVREGGVWRFDMHGPDGRDYPNRVVFDEVERPQRLVYSHTGDADVEPVAFTTTVTFEAHEGKTKLTLRQTFPTAAERERVNREYGAVEGGMQTLARLAAHLSENTGGAPLGLTIAVPSEREIVLRRAFDAPRRLVFEAFAKPEHIRRWWGCGAMEMTECTMDFRPGGGWRFVHTDAEGNEHPFTGEYREIAEPDRIVQTFIYDVDGVRDSVAVETIDFEQRSSRTVLTLTILHPSREARDGRLHSGMEFGATSSMNRLEALLAGMRSSEAPVQGATP